MERRRFLECMGLMAALARTTWASASNGRRLATAARAQVGITTGYDPQWRQLSYPGGDVPRNTGVCADVVIRAARDGLGIDLQKLVHEDIAAHFAAYPARRVWGSTHPDANIDHRRVLNLETYFERVGAQLWRAAVAVPGDSFPVGFAEGDIVTWLLDARLPHIGIIVSSGVSSAGNRNARVVHNIGRGAEESEIGEFYSERAIAHYRWPKSS
ncbi:MAG TPA: DUF1287 domain-containing protein [Terracidiphilus sp.]|jgi:uncharacterized protein YijF (DUF1287 family)|nr:DUF1287 domain-containing protein [Terracidiphilus sp.]